MSNQSCVRALVLLASIVSAAPAMAQNASPPPAPAQLPAQQTSWRPEQPWSIDFGMGWNSSLSGNINSGGIGTLNGLAAVIVPNRYEDAYGAGLYLHFGGGYKISELNELRANLTFQKTDADLVQLGDLGTSKLYGQYDPYKSLTIDVGIRRYLPTNSERVRFYAEGLLGLGFLAELDAELAAPGENVVSDAVDVYDRTTAFTLSAHAGALFRMHERVDLNARIGIRYLTGLASANAFDGTGLESITDGTSRWTLPFVVGVSFRF